MASAQIPLPEKLDSKNPEEWKRWIERFECYRIAAELDEKDDKVQINTLVYAMGEDANEILRSFQLGEADQTYDAVKARFATHFVGRTDVIFILDLTSEFKKTKESVIDFIESLYQLAETCQFGALKDELIRDRIVVGIRNAALSQKLMQDDTLTLDKAVKQAKSLELVKEHHDILKGDGEEGKIKCIGDTRKKRPWKEKGKLSEERKDQKNPSRPPVKRCHRCRKSPRKKRGHFASVCKSKVIHSVEEELQDINSDESEDCYFLGAVHGDESQTKWTANLTLGKAMVRFKIDTGADVTVIPEPVYLEA